MISHLGTTTDHGRKVNHANEQLVHLGVLKKWDPETIMLQFPTIIQYI